MAGKMRKLTIAGRAAEVPEENYADLVQQLEADGVQFGPSMDADIPDDQQQVRGGPAGTTPFVEPNPNMQGEFREPKSMLEQLLEGGEDAVSGLTHGATMHADNLLGDQYRARNAEGANRNPNVYGTAEMIGGALPNLISGGAGYVRQGGNAIARMLGNASAQGLQGAAQGAVRGFSDSDPNAPLEERVGEGVDNASREGLLSALVSGGADMLGNAGGWGRDVWARAGDKARSAAVGLGGQDLKKLAESQGLDFVTENVGRLPDELGVTNKFWPQNAETYAKRLQGRADVAKNQVDQSTVDAAAQGVQGPGFIDKTRITGPVRNEAAAARGGAMGDREAQAGALDSVADGISQQKLSTPEQLLALKRQFDSRAYPNSLEGSSESLMGKAHGVAGNAVRQELRDAMGFALPETNQAFTQGNIDLGHAATLAPVARDKAAKDWSGGGVMGNLATGALGYGAGAAMGSGAIGAAAGLARPIVAGAQQYGPDFGANISRGMEAASGWTGDLGTASAGAGVGPMAGALTPSEAQRQRAEESRGYLGGDAVRMVLQRNPEALGEYGDELQQAEQNGTLNGTLYKLFMRDQEFRSRVYPQIQQLTRAE